MNEWVLLRSALAEYKVLKQELLQMGLNPGLSGSDEATVARMQAKRLETIRELIILVKLTDSSTVGAFFHSLAIHHKDAVLKALQYYRASSQYYGCLDIVVDIDDLTEHLETIAADSESERLGEDTE